MADVRLHKRPLAIALGCAVSHGILAANAVLYYLRDILQMAGVRSPLVVALLIGLVKLLGVLVALLSIKRVGKRNLLLLGTCGTILGHLGLALALSVDQGALRALGCAISFRRRPWRSLACFCLSLRGTRRGRGSCMSSARRCCRSEEGVWAGSGRRRLLAAVLCRESDLGGLAAAAGRERAVWMAGGIGDAGAGVCVRHERDSRADASCRTCHVRQCPTWAPLQNDSPKIDHAESHSSQRERPPVSFNKKTASCSISPTQRRPAAGRRCTRRTRRQNRARPTRPGDGGAALSGARQLQQGPLSGARDRRRPALAAKGRLG